LIVGTLAVKEPTFVDELCRFAAGRVIVGLDARDGFVATDGWAEASSQSAVDVAKRFENVGVSEIVYTDISRDGMMRGVNVKATSDLAAAITIPVVASGGVSSLKDIEALAAVSGDGVSGAIVGRALYEGGFNLTEAQSLADALSAKGA